MRTYRAEFHVHTVLSPCAEVEMIPPLIVQEALERGIDLVAITDHNASANVQAVQKAAAGTGLVVLPGIEVQTREEVHVLCLFDTLAQLASFQETIDRHLPRIENDIEHFGEQFVVDETGEFIRRETRLLLTSVDLSIEDIFREASLLEGLAVPAHIDRKAFGLIANLGFIPPDLPVEAVEISRHLDPSKVQALYPQVRSFPLIRSGDVHRLDEFLGANQLTLAAPTLAEIRMALRGQDERSCLVRSGLL